MTIVRTPRAIIEILGAPDSEGNYPIVSYEIERHYTFEGDGSQFFTPKVQRDEATIEEVNALRGASETTLTAQFADLNTRFAALQTERDELRASVSSLQTRLDRILAAVSE